MTKAMLHKYSITGAGDVTLAGSLISSPVWASFLSDFNELLTTITLVIGVILGLARLWTFWMDRSRPQDGSIDRHSTND